MTDDELAEHGEAIYSAAYESYDERNPVFKRDAKIALARAVLALVEASKQPISLEDIQAMGLKVPNGTIEDFVSEERGEVTFHNCPTCGSCDEGCGCPPLASAPAGG